MVKSVSKHQQEKSLKLGINRKTNNVNNNYDSYKKFKHQGLMFYLRAQAVIWRVSSPFFEVYFRSCASLNRRLFPKY